MVYQESEMLGRGRMEHIRRSYKAQREPGERNIRIEGQRQSKCEGKRKERDSKGKY